MITLIRNGERRRCINEYTIFPGAMYGIRFSCCLGFHNHTMHADAYRKLFVVRLRYIA